MRTTLLSLSLLLCCLHATAQEVVVLTEDFGKFTAGSEQYPDRTDLCLKELDWCISPALLHTPGWNGGGIYQAGGCAYIYGFWNDYSQQYELGYLESPRIDVSGNWGEFIVRFRARTVLEQDWLGVCGVPGEGKAEQKFAVIGQNWGWYEVTLSCGDADTRVQFEPLEDGCYIDDITILRRTGSDPDPVYQLDTPLPLPVEDYSPLSYTARWRNVQGADDYAVYDYLYHTARSEGEPFYYIDTDFGRITEGSTDSPVSPGKDMDFGMYLDDIVGRADWLVHMPMYAGGALGLDNSYSAMMSCGVESPALHLAAPGRDLHVSVDLMSPELHDMSLYVYGRTALLGQYSLDMTPSWTNYHITIPQCEDGVTLELVVEDTEAGYAYVDNLRVWQNLPLGTVARVPVGYYETAATQLHIDTPDTPDGYRHAYSVSAYQYTLDEEGDVVDYIMSAWSDPVFADGAAPEGIKPLRTTTSSTGHDYDVQGRRLSPAAAQRGMVIRDGHKLVR